MLLQKVFVIVIILWPTIAFQVEKPSPGVAQVRRRIFPGRTFPCCGSARHPSSPSSIPLPTVKLPFSGYLTGFTGEIRLNKKIEKHLGIAV